MSQYSRAEFNANAGIVVGISPADYPGGVLAGVEFQRAGSAPPSRPAAATTAPRRSAWRTSSPAAPRPRSARWPQLPTRHPPGGPVRLPAGLRGGGHARSPPRLRPAGARLRHGRRGDDGRGNPHLLPRPPAPGRRLPERQHGRPFPRRRRRGLRRRHPVRRRGRHPRRGSGGDEPHGQEVPAEWSRRRSEAALVYG
jgi:hypothetical protein